MYSWTAYIEYITNNEIRPSIQGFVDFSLKFPSTRRMCRHNNASSESLIHSVPEIISFFLPNSQDNSILSSFQFNKSISIYDKNNIAHVLNIKSIIYFGQSHFTSRLVDRNFDIWYFDSLNPQGRSIKERRFDLFTPDELFQKDSKYVSCIVYAKSY